MGSAGGSKSSSSGQSNAFSRSRSGGTNWNEAESGGASMGSSLSGGQSTSGGMSAQDVWGPQAGGLGQLYGSAQSLLSGGGGAGNASQIADQARGSWAQQLVPGGNPYFERSMQGAIDQATSGFARGTLPELESRAVQVGQLGQPRDQLARGEAAGMFGQGLAANVSQGYAQQYGADQQRAMQALGMTGNMQQAQYSPQYAARDLLGGPTVLGRSSQTGQSSNFGQSENASNQYSQSQGGGQNWANSVSNALSNQMSKSGSMNVGVGAK